MRYSTLRQQTDTQRSQQFLHAALLSLIAHGIYFIPQSKTYRSRTVNNKTLWTCLKVTTVHTDIPL